MKQNTTDRFLIGSWVSFYSFDIHSYEYQLDQMHNAGLNFNIYPAVFGGGIQTPEYGRKWSVSMRSAICSTCCTAVWRKIHGLSAYLMLREKIGASAII